jgi:hypothetical protein
MSLLPAVQPHTRNKAYNMVSNGFSILLKSLGITPEALAEQAKGIAEPIAKKFDAIQQQLDRIEAKLDGSYAATHAGAIEHVRTS